ncbi:unnamed protein product, partial [Durusdinium trenchii]
CRWMWRIGSNRRPLRRSFAPAPGTSRFQISSCTSRITRHILGGRSLWTKRIQSGHKRSSPMPSRSPCGVGGRVGLGKSGNGKSTSTGTAFSAT